VSRHFAQPRHARFRPFTSAMSLVRATTRACPRAAHTTARAQRRNASDHAGHDAHHHDEHAVDTTVYPKEGASDPVLSHYYPTN
jgi:hypothetical protein